MQLRFRPGRKRAQVRQHTSALHNPLVDGLEVFEVGARGDGLGQAGSSSLSTLVRHIGQVLCCNQKRDSVYIETEFHRNT